MRQRLKAGGHRPYVFAVLALVPILYIACVVLLIVTRDFRAASENAWAIPALVFAALGAVVAWHQPRNPIGWLLAACGVLNLLIDGAGLYSVLDFRIHHGTLPLGPAEGRGRPGRGRRRPGHGRIAPWNPPTCLYGSPTATDPDGHPHPASAWLVARHGQLHPSLPDPPSVTPATLVDVVDVVTTSQVE